MSDEIVRHTQVGGWIRRIDPGSGRMSPWGRITMAIPSRHGPCWLVDLYNGSLEVWRIHDLTVRYELLPDLMKGEHRGRPGD